LSRENRIANSIGEEKGVPFKRNITLTNRMNDMQTPPPAPVAEDGQPLVRPTILLVEDDKVLQELYVERFSVAGLNVIQAFDGMQALEELDNHPEVQLILLDIMLPKLSGYDVLARVKRDASKRNIPIIVVSALADIDDQAKGLQLGASEYITKGEMLPGAVIDKIKKYVFSIPRTEE
jgi:CheY-like chemotaxis protein